LQHAVQPSVKKNIEQTEFSPRPSYLITLIYRAATTIRCD